MDNNLTRAFICIDFPEEVIKEVARIQELIQNKKFAGKLTELENIHLTLKFLGEISQETLNQVQQKLSQAKFTEFEASLGQVGTFSHHKSPRIVWIKIHGKSLRDLQKQIDLALEPLFPKEQRFMSHLTLARIKYVKDKKDFTDYIKKIHVKKIKFKVSSFKLKSSDLRSLGPIYTTLQKYSPNTQQSHYLHVF